MFLALCSHVTSLVLVRRIDVHVGHAIDHVIPEAQIVLERLNVLFQLLKMVECRKLG